ncbi:MAG: glutathione peroxidase [Balneolaceae bacterium]
MNSVKNDDSLFDFKLKNISGEEIALSNYEGEVLLIVNTASECGFTPQYKGLQSLYEKYRSKGFTVLGFPANNFGGQEPGTDEEIQQFCDTTFGVTFPLFSKVSVKGGDQHSLFEWLTSQEAKGAFGAIKWNFEKFLLDRDGMLVRRFRSVTRPDSKKMINAIQELL